MRMLLLPAAHPSPVDKTVDVVDKKHDKAGHHGEVGEVVGRSDGPEHDEHHIVGTITAGMTTNLNIKYKRPIPTIEGTKIEIRAHIREMKRNFALMEASIQCNGELCTTAELTFYCFPQEKAREEFHFMPYEVEE